MDINYSNNVTGSDFETLADNFSIKGKYRKDAATGKIVEFSATITRPGSSYEQPSLAYLRGEDLAYTLNGLTAYEAVLVFSAMEGLTYSLTHAEN